MKLRFAITTLSFLVCLSSHDARAHYDSEGSVMHPGSKAKQHSTSNKKANAGKGFDIVQLLNLAMSPAFGASANVRFGTEGSYRTVAADGIPDHPTGAFPNAGNPNRISAQDYHFKMPLHPTLAGSNTALRMNLFGIALNGVPFDPGAAEWWNGDPSSGWQYEAMALGSRLGLDQNNAHVQPNGAYHYHGLPEGLLKELAARRKPVLLGYAADGFPIYAPFGNSNGSDPKSKMKELRSSYRVKRGSRPDGPRGTYNGLFVEDYEYVKGAGDLDECNGRFGVTSEYPSGIYHYVITTEFPFVPRYFKGTPDASFEKRPRFGPGVGPGPGGRPGFGGGSGPGGRPGFGGGPGPGGRPGFGGGPGPGGRPGFGGGPGHGGPPPPAGSNPEGYGLPPYPGANPEGYVPPHRRGDSDELQSR